MVLGSNLVCTRTSRRESLSRCRVTQTFEQREKQNCSSSEPSISCSTFNILAPIYKRLGNESSRESQFRDNWLSRNQNILDKLTCERSSIICLQEFWVGNEELVDMYEKRLGEAGYVTKKLARANDRGDGLLTAIHKDQFKVLSYRELFFADCGDRVAQLLHVQSIVPFFQSPNDNIQQEVLIVNTHLLFPHHSTLSFIRLRQVYKILEHMESYQKENKLSPMPIILCGDWNGSKRGHVYKFLRSQGFVSSYDVAHNYTDNDADAHKPQWVSHRNHRGNICGVDFIWLLNPNKFRKSLKTSWTEAAFSIIKHHLLELSFSEYNAFKFLRSSDDGGNQADCITFSGFFQALCQLNLSNGIKEKELEEFWASADADGDGVLDYAEFHRLWHPLPLESMQKIEMNSEEPAIGCFHVKDAVLFPPEVERGMWPDNYSLSDHAKLTVVFSPVRRSTCLEPQAIC